MNRWIAKWFGRFLAVMHGLFFIAVILTASKLLQNDLTATQAGINPRLVIPIAIGVCVLYILIMGVISTFVSINSYLAELVERQNGGNTSSGWVASTAPAERIEPDL